MVGRDPGGPDPPHGSGVRALIPARCGTHLVGKRTRQLLVFAQVVLSLGWMGAGAANVVLTSTAAVTGDVELRRACYLLVREIDTWLVIPGAFGALVSGVVLSLVPPEASRRTGGCCSSSG